ncbi:MAG: succinylglutamate desuccinylase/aspartoacylase family protein [Planctomycetaceae bacterium]|nr:succinylglutamate desuccinylase/aspartoacylase family protein [Planctomycetaceae bacterium]
MSSFILRVTSNAPGPRLLVTAGVHGNEFAPMAAARRLASDLEGRLTCGTLTVVPIVNEPAFLRASRAGDDGLDLARTCPGRSDGSPTECIAAELSELIRAADYYIDLHDGGGELLIAPLAGYVLHPDPRVLDEQRRMAKAMMLPIIWGTDPTLNGRSLSVARDAGVPAIYTEYHGGTRYETAEMHNLLAGCRNVAAELGMIADPVQQRSRNPIIVEDARPQSGHLQIQHPSPCDGFFEPSVEIGEPIVEGQELGEVWWHESSQKVVARQTGLVLALRTLARVHTGDALAVILEGAELAGQKRSTPATKS